MANSCSEDIYYLPMILAVCYCAFVSSILVLIVYKYKNNLSKAMFGDKGRKSSKKVGGDESASKSKKPSSVDSKHLPVTSITKNEMSDKKSDTSSVKSVNDKKK
uniref:Uncharacterized protein n=1 Tax=Strongyloides stercoralis TaxID=6248 RepID=A0A0K0ET85_STRER